MIAKILLALILLVGCGPVGQSIGLSDKVHAQEVKKEILDHIRNVSVSIEWEYEGKQRCHGSGTLVEKDGEFYVITANHVVVAADGKQMRAAQRFHNKKHVSVNAEVVSQCFKTDLAILKVGSGVFEHGAKLYGHCMYPCNPKRGWLRSRAAPPELDTPIVHCGSMAGLHHTVTRGHIVGIDRDMDEIGLKTGPRKADHADLTAFYGSSGGGLFLAEDGRFMGMIYAGIPQRICFFLPLRSMDLDAIK